MQARPQRFQFDRLKSYRPVAFRLPTSDIKLVKAEAARLGVSEQTLWAAIVERGQPTLAELRKRDRDCQAECEGR